MKSSVWTYAAPAVVGLAIIIGCSSVFEQISGEAGQGGGTGGSDRGFAQVESTFSDAPVSPGATGGPVTGGLTLLGDPMLVGEQTRSFFTAFQIDPEAEDTAGPKFVVAADMDQDGQLDLITGWNQSQPIQLHLQRRDDADNVSFRTVTLAGTTPIAVVAGVQVGQINDDGWLDVVVLAKATAYVTLCPPENPGDAPAEISNLEGEIVVLFSPGNAGLISDGDAWDEMILVNPFVRDVWIHNQFPGHESKEFNDIKTQPEWGGFTDLEVANIDGQPGDDIVVALNPGECKTLDQEPPLNTVDLWVNPGPGLSELPDQWGAPDPGTPGRRVPLSLFADAPQVKDIAVMDIDDDNDLDVIATYTNAISQNIRWARNPRVPHFAGGVAGLAAVVSGTSDGFRLHPREWQQRPIGQVDSAADIIRLGDIDNDGHDDILVRSTDGAIIQWFRRPNPLSIQPEFPPNDAVPGRFNFPWPVFTMTEFSGTIPEAIAIGDITGDGKVEVVAAASGGVLWYDGTVGPTVYDPWSPNKIIQDSPIAQPTAPPAPAAPSSAGPAAAALAATAPGAGVGVTAVSTSTHINTLLVVDLDDDGRNDIVGTLDRRDGSGLSDDRLVWYRNTQTQPPRPGSRGSRPLPKEGGE